MRLRFVRKALIDRPTKPPCLLTYFNVAGSSMHEMSGIRLGTADTHFNALAA